MPTKPLPSEDLSHILTHAREPFIALKDANIFITGGTGFFGHWLLESLIYANEKHTANIRATVLTRNASAFRAKSPHIANDPTITLLEGDILTFAFPAQPHTHIVHAATDSGGQQGERKPEELYNEILAGTQHVLDFAQHTGAKRFLYTSTGAVYGRSTTLLHTPETYFETHTPQLAPYSYEAAKRAAEDLCLTTTLGPVIARCFAFVGPHLPLDQHFAIGNFIGSTLDHRPIHIKGDGTPRRSWLYMADLSIWLWTLLASGKPNRAYNVGSNQGMTIAEAARVVQSALLPAITSNPFPTEVAPILIDGIPNAAAALNSYVPCIDRAHKELNLQVRIPLEEALRRTANWLEKYST
jgi:nucleoside-diphosphate-sugar epimerase